MLVLEAVEVAVTEENDKHKKKYAARTSTSNHPVLKSVIPIG